MIFPCMDGKEWGRGQGRLTLHSPVVIEADIVRQGERCQVGYAKKGENNGEESKRGGLGLKRARVGLGGEKVTV